ncbi:MAG: hypothetical protein V3R78_10055 [Thermodesulfobacteriota bacterium]
MTKDINYYINQTILVGLMAAFSSVLVVAGVASLVGLATEALTWL